MTKRPPAPPHQVPEDLMTLREAAAKVKLSVKTLERLISSGGLKAYKVGSRSIRVAPDDLAGLIRPIVPVDEGVA